ncbi:Hypothetical predicted protein [Cloeon dipterum]|uniref:nitric-oxide synthase (NADPH) n=1 Tax=Cloeon dipterum TaxID=197152 RepID=A0A8S1C490_9INSE|nr:Hypothetical predicted protein [Cloeon dipterum]
MPRRVHARSQGGGLVGRGGKAVVGLMRDKEHLLARPSSPSPPCNNHSSPSHRKPIRLRNLLNQTETFDLLNQQVVESVDARLTDSMSTPDGSAAPITNGNGAVPKPFLRLRNWQSKDLAVDRLHNNANPRPTQCSEKTCMGSIMAIPGRSALIPRNKEEVLRLARDFMDQYFASIRRLNSAAHQSRWAQVCKEVDESGTYQLTNTELVYGAKLAWRNSSRCIGRIQWSKLQFCTQLPPPD